jgi:hypothetical protein
VLVFTKLEELEQKIININAGLFIAEGSKHVAF